MRSTSGKTRPNRRDPDAAYIWARPSYHRPARYRFGRSHQTERAHRWHRPARASKLISGSVFLKMRSDAIITESTARTAAEFEHRSNAIITAPTARRNERKAVMAPHLAAALLALVVSNSTAFAGSSTTTFYGQDGRRTGSATTSGDTTTFYGPTGQRTGTCSN